MCEKDISHAEVFTGAPSSPLRPPSWKGGVRSFSCMAFSSGAQQLALLLTSLFFSGQVHSPLISTSVCTLDLGLRYFLNFFLQRHQRWHLCNSSEGDEKHVLNTCASTSVGSRPRLDENSSVHRPDCDWLNLPARSL